MASVTPIDTARSPLAYAQRYARIGWHVFPLWWAEQGDDGAWRCACGQSCASPAKHPIGQLVRRGQDDASFDEARIRQWWTTYPRANIGIALAASGLVAVDVDPRNGGLETMERLEAEHGPIDSGVLAFTGGGGEHRVFALPAEQAVSLPGKLGPGVDLKRNGYIVAEPSTHVSGRSYAWEASSDPLEGAVPGPLPDWVRDLVRQLHGRPDAPAAVPRAPLPDGEIERLRQALAAVPSDDREVWLRAGMAIHNDVGGQDGFALWDAWSQGSHKYDPVDQMRVWRSFRRRPMGEAVQLPTVYGLAYEFGFRRPPAPVVIEEAALLHGAQPQEQVRDDGTPRHLLTIPGALGRAVDWINATARKPQPLLGVQAALALGSAVLGRRYRTTNGNWSMLYFLNIAQSGAGKEHAKHAVESLLEAAGLGTLIGAGRFASESGVISALIDRPAQFSVLDEFGKMLQAASVAQNYADRNTMKALMEVWGRADGVLRPVAYSTAGLSSRQAEDLAKRLVRKPSLTLLALTTPETLFSGLTSAAVADGFLNRFLAVHADRGRQMARPVEHIEPPADLIEWMQRTHAGVDRAGNMATMPAPHDMEPTPIVVGFDGAALEVFRAIEQRVLERMDELDAEGLAEMLSRLTETAMRLSLIVAISLGRDKIDSQAAKWAADYAAHHAERGLQMMRERLSDGPFDQLCKEIIRLVRRAGARGMTERDLDKASRSWRGSPERMRMDALASLQRREYLTLVTMTGPGGRGRKRSAFVDSAIVNNADNADKTGTHASAI